VNYLEIICCFCAGVFVGWLILARAPKFVRVPAPESLDRGPRADLWYNRAVISGKGYQFTDEELARAASREDKYAGVP
jgi:hypothetical protein